MTISYLDILSIAASILNKILKINLPDVWMDSFMPRVCIALVGGLLLLTGGLLYKKSDKQDRN